MEIYDADHLEELDLHEAFGTQNSGKTGECDLVLSLSLTPREVVYHPFKQSNVGLRAANQTGHPKCHVNTRPTGFDSGNRKAVSPLHPPFLRFGYTSQLCSSSP
nr:hypothetical protein HmN_000691200 [Hymenolepis microstoma]